MGLRGRTENPITSMCEPDRCQRHAKTLDMEGALPGPSHSRRSRNPTLVVATCLAAAAGPAGAGQAEARALTVELNRIDQTGTACRLTFMAENGLGADLDGLTLETVLIDGDGRVDRLTLFDFQSVPSGAPRVRQFDLPELDCAALGRVLFNGVAQCSGEGLEPGDCADALTLTSRVDVEVTG